MSDKNTTEDSQEEQNMKPKKGAAKFTMIALVVILGILAFFGKQGWDKYSATKRSDAFLSEAESFIEGKRFDRAKESLQLAEESMPNRSEVAEMNSLLLQEENISRIEKELTTRLRESNWVEAEALAAELMQEDANNVQLPQAQEEIRVGKLKEQVDGIETKLAAARESDDLQAVTGHLDQLIELDPTNSNANEWEALKVSTLATIKERDDKAAVMHGQALTLDNGVYNEQLLFLATQANDLSDKPVYQEFFDKVNAYPREIAYPAEYATLQEAVDVARAIDTIKISKGDYHSPTVINKQLKLVGEKGESIILHCTGSEGAALFIGPKGKVTVEDLMFKHSDEADAESSYSAVVVSGQADFTSCLFYESSAHGLHAVDGGQVTLNSCRAEGNRWDGLAASGEGSKLTITASISTKNKHNGVDAWDGGLIELVDSFSENNTRSGAVATKGGNLVVEGSTLRTNNHAGLYVTEGGNATLKNSELSSNMLAGAFGDKSGKVEVVEPTKVISNQIAGVVLTEGTTWSGLDQFTYTDNVGKDLWENAEFEVVKAIVVEEDEPATEDSDAPAQESPTEDTTESSDSPVQESPAEDVDNTEE